MRDFLCVLLIVASVANGLASAQGSGAVWYPRTGWSPGAEDKLQACACHGLSCGCCFRLNVPEVHLDDTGCVNLTYLPANIGFDLTLSLNGKVIFKKEVSVKNPPALCVNIPHLKKLAKICVHLYNMRIIPGAVSGCAEIVVKLAYVIQEKIPLGCFRIPIPGDHALDFTPTLDLAAAGKTLMQDWDTFVQLLQRQEGGEELLVMEHLLKGFHQVLEEAIRKRALKEGV